jgi:hypothetical protein
MHNSESDDYARFPDLIWLVAQFDGGQITRREFQQRVRALSNEELLVISRILNSEYGHGTEKGAMAASA